LYPSSEQQLPTHAYQTPKTRRREFITRVLETTLLNDTLNTVRIVIPLLYPTRRFVINMIFRAGVVEWQTRRTQNKPDRWLPPRIERIPRIPYHSSQLSSV
jgi:hypothetical protein